MLFGVRTQIQRMLNTSLKPVYWSNSIASNLSFYKSIKLYFFHPDYIIENKLLSQFFAFFTRYSPVELMCTRIPVSFVTHQSWGMQLFVHRRRVICIFSLILGNTESILLAIGLFFLNDSLALVSLEKNVLFVTSQINLKYNLIPYVGLSTLKSSILIFVYVKTDIKKGPKWTKLRIFQVSKNYYSFFGLISISTYSYQYKIWVQNWVIIFWDLRF